MDNLDTSKIFTEVASGIANNIVRSIYRAGSSQYKKALVVFELCFNSHIKRSYSKYSRIKTLLYRDKPVDLKKHYVNANFSIRKKTLKEEYLVSNLQRYKRIVITGTGGCGKSLFLKRLLTRIIDDKIGYIPVFVELRYLTLMKKEPTNIITFLFKLLNDINSDFTAEQLKYALKNGKIFLLLDGFDEIEHTLRPVYEEEILNISYKYPNLLLFVSGRPDGVFYSWDEFTVLTVNPFNKDQALNLIEKIDYDEKVKNEFISSLKKELFNKHRSFLSNPLLITMMLLTYEQLAGIPEKLHIFYEQAFDTLFYKHDALKSLYKRISYSGLPIDEFKTLFSAFCILSYSEKKHSFNKDEVISYIETASKIECIDTKPESYLKDLLKSVCMMQKDGLNYLFSHRSFQEYFSALFISKTLSAKVERIIDKVALFSTQDKMLDMLFDMNRELVELKWIIPKLDDLKNTLFPINIEKNTFKYLSVILDRIVILDDERFQYVLRKDDPKSTFFVWLDRLYKDKHSIDPMSPQNEQSKNTIKNIKKCMEKYKLEFINRVPEEVLISDLALCDGEDWIKESIIFDFCLSVNNFYKSLESELKEKYQHKKATLSEILLGRK